MNMTEEYNRLISDRIGERVGGNSDAFKQYRKRTRGFDNTQSD